MLDESKDTKGHPIFGVGGMVMDVQRISEVERSWLATKETHPAIKFSDTPPDGCFELFAAIGQMPVQKELEHVYSRCWEGSCPIGQGQSWLSLKEAGFSAGLLNLGHGPLHEIADFVVSGLTLFAAVRCAEHRGKRVDPERSRKNALCAPIMPLLPRRPGTEKRVGWSVVVHARQLTGKELLKQNLDSWCAELESRRSGSPP